MRYRPILHSLMVGTSTCTTVFFTAAVIHERGEKRTPWWQNPVYRDTPLGYLQSFYTKKHKWYQDWKAYYTQQLPWPLTPCTEAKKTVATIMVLYTTACLVRATLIRPKRIMLTQWSVSMLGLGLCGSSVHDRLGREQFVAFWVSLCLGAHTTSQITRHFYPRPLSPTLFSMGTSATYGLFAADMVYQDHSFARYTLPAVMSVDITGILLRWHWVDHFAHLGGAGLGYLYMNYGPDIIWPYMLQTVRDLKRKGEGERGKGEGGGGDKPSDTLMEIPRQMRIKLLGKKVIVPEEQ